MQWEEKTDKVEVPENTGIEGFLHTIRELLRRPRMQQITIDSKGMITYRHYVQEGQPANNVGIEFGDISPHGIIRNAEVVELAVDPGQSAAAVIAAVMDLAAVEQYQPVAFATGADSVFWGWYSMTTGVSLNSRHSIMGLPVYTDRLLPDTALILCTAYGKDAALVDTQRAYKVEMELAATPPPDTTVEVLK
jgi:hypothetical protein